jgi:hypothetical protein
LLKKCDKFFENFLDAFFQDYEKASWKLIWKSF